MNQQSHDRTLGDAPWRPIPPQQELYTKENPYIEGGTKYWTEGKYPEEVRVIGVGPNGEFVVPKTNWYPDEIYDQEQRLQVPDR